MTAQETINRLNAIQAEILRELPARLEVAGNDVSALIQQRIVQTGKDSDGGSFTPYSDTPVPAYWYKGRSRNSAGESAVTALAQQGEYLSYKEFRRLNGLNTAPKNFEFNGEMWRGEVAVNEGNGSRVSVIIKGGNKTSADRLKWSRDRENKNLLEPSEKEIELARLALQNWITAKLTSL